MSTESKQQGRRHYHVICDTPDEGPPDLVIVANKRDAELQMIAFKRYYLDFNEPWETDDGVPRYMASGSARSGLIDISDAMGSGSVISSTMCRNPKCLEKGQGNEPT